MREIERAKANGRWNAAYAPQSTATVPGDLQTALGLAPDALRLFDWLDSANRYAILYRIHQQASPRFFDPRRPGFRTLGVSGRDQPMVCPMKVATNAPAIPSPVVSMKPFGRFGPCDTKRAIMPAPKPITKIQIMFDMKIFL
jgi:hypothetical protein